MRYIRFSLFIAPVGITDCCSLAFIDEHFAHDEKLSQYKSAAAKIQAGNIESREDYIANVVAKISPIYGAAYNSAFIKSCLSILRLAKGSLISCISFHLKSQIISSRTDSMVSNWKINFRQIQN